MTATEIPKTEIAPTTSSKLTRRLGFAALAGLVVFLAMALVISPPELTQRDAVRLFYLHVPSATIAFYLAPSIIAAGSVMYLWKKSTFWDLAAGAAAEIGVMFSAFTLITGMLWGRPTWGIYWTWDPRLTTTAVSFILFVGYLAVRRLDMDATIRSQRAAVLGIIASANTLLVRYSVEIWQGLHQGTTISPMDMQITGTMWASALIGLVSLALVFAWLLVHRFRVAWLEHQLEVIGLDHAISERRAERTTASGGTSALGGTALGGTAASGDPRLSGEGT